MHNVGFTILIEMESFVKYKYTKKVWVPVHEDFNFNLFSCDFYLIYTKDRKALTC
jgi:hypothetical protein